MRFVTCSVSRSIFVTFLRIFTNTAMQQLVSVRSFLYCWLAFGNFLARKRAPLEQSGRLFVCLFVWFCSYKGEGFAGVKVTVQFKTEGERSH